MTLFLRGEVGGGGSYLGNLDGPVCHLVSFGLLVWSKHQVQNDKRRTSQKSLYKFLKRFQKLVKYKTKRFKSGEIGGNKV